MLRMEAGEDEDGDDSANEDFHIRISLSYDPNSERPRMDSLRVEEVSKGGAGTNVQN